MARKRKTFLLLLLCLGLLLTAACGESAPAHADLQGLYDRFAAEPDMPEMLVLSAKQADSFYGLDVSACPQAVLAICDEGLRVDEIWLIEAENPEQAGAILDIARSHVEQICSETENYLPDQYAVAKNARVLQVGNTVALLLSPRAAEMEQAFRDSFKG